MSKNKQTAVEWLVQEINKINVSTEARIFINKLEQKAKEMEKQQIVKAAQDNFYAGQDLANGYKIDWNSAEQYYNEEYGGNK